MIQLPAYYMRFPQVLVGKYKDFIGKTKSGYQTVETPKGVVAYGVVKKGDQLVVNVYADFEKKRTGRKKS